MRAAPLAALALIAAGCGSHVSAKPQLPADGPSGVVRIALAHVLWPLDPARARTRDETVVARALFATPLRTDPRTGALRPGLCTSWLPLGGGRWAFRCRHALEIAAELRRAHLVRRAGVVGRMLVVAGPGLPYVLTEARAFVIREYLTKNFKLDDTRIKTIGLGKAKEPAAGGKVEILVYPVGTTAPGGGVVK